MGVKIRMQQRAKSSVAREKSSGCARARRLRWPRRQVEMQAHDPAFPMEKRQHQPRRAMLGILRRILKRAFEHREIPTREDALRMQLHPGAQVLIDLRLQVATSG